MPMSKLSPKLATTEENRGSVFAEKIETGIWQEIPASDNPYIAESVRCHGYDLLELMRGSSFVEVFYLLFRGNLPGPDEKKLLESLMIALINPGPRHPAVRAAMTAAVSKTDESLLLPIATTLLSGKNDAAGILADAMNFIGSNHECSAPELAHRLARDQYPPEFGEWQIAPGFGSNFNGAAIMPQKFADHLIDLSNKWKHLEWGNSFARALNEYDCGWLITGLAAAAFLDLGFSQKAAAGLYQILSSPGIFAHALEFTNKPLTAMPFVADKDYTIEHQ